MNSSKGQEKIKKKVCVLGKIPSKMVFSCTLLPVVNYLYIVFVLCIELSSLIQL
jgi:hypothetical protein